VPPVGGKAQRKDQFCHLRFAERVLNGWILRDLGADCGSQQTLVIRRVDPDDLPSICERRLATSAREAARLD